MLQCWPRVTPLNDRWLNWKRQFSRVRAAHPRLFRNVAFGAGAAMVLVFGLVAWLVAGVLSGLPNIEALRRIGEMDQATAVYDRNDRLAFTIYKEQRIEVPLEQVSPTLTSAILSIEDQRFYRPWRLRPRSHRLGDCSPTSGAGRLAQGGSTITQQLARQSFLTPDKTLRRKVQELDARRADRAPLHRSLRSSSCT